MRKKDKKEINKLDLASTILVKACNLEATDSDTVIKQIKFLDNNGRIKKASTTKKISKTAWDWFKRKVL